MKLKDYLALEKETVQSFAVRVGCTPVAIYRYLSGERTPRPRVMRAITAATRGAVTANDFVDQQISAPSDCPEAA